MQSGLLGDPVIICCKTYEESFLSTPHRLSSARMKIKITRDFLAASAWGWGWGVSRNIRRKNVCGQGIGHRHSGSLSFLIQLFGRISF